MPFGCPAVLNEGILPPNPAQLAQRLLEDVSGLAWWSGREEHADPYGFPR